MFHLMPYHRSLLKNETKWIFFLLVWFGFWPYPVALSVTRSVCGSGSEPWRCSSREELLPLLLGQGWRGTAPRAGQSPSPWGCHRGELTPPSHLKHIIVLHTLGGRCSLPQVTKCALFRQGREMLFNSSAQSEQDSAQDSAAPAPTHFFKNFFFPLLSRS